GGCTEEEQIFAGCEMPYPAAEANPRLECEPFKESHSRSGRQEHRAVLLGDGVNPIAKVFVRVPKERQFDPKRSPRVVAQRPGVADVERESFAGMNHVVGKGGAWHTLIADEGAAYSSGNLVLFVLGGHPDGYKHQRRRHEKSAHLSSDAKRRYERT